MKPIIVMLACNHWRNGHFQGHASSVNACGLTLESPWVDKFLKVREIGKEIRVGNRLWPFFGCKEWYGNWCWNAYALRPDHAAELLTYVRSKGYRPESGPEEMFGDVTYTAASLLAVGNRPA